MRNNIEQMTRADVVDLVKEKGYEQAYNLLLLGGPDFFDGSSAEYNRLLADIENGFILDEPAPMKVHAVKRVDPSVVCEYDNVVKITDPIVPGLGYCKRLLLEDGRAIDFLAQDWKVLKLEWVEV